MPRPDEQRAILSSLPLEVRTVCELTFGRYKSTVRQRQVLDMGGRSPQRKVSTPARVTAGLGMCESLLSQVQDALIVWATYVVDITPYCGRLQRYIVDTGGSDPAELFVNI